MNKRNPMAAQTIAQKQLQYNNDCAQNARAYKSDETTVPLCDVPVGRVEFIGGLWRVQDKNDYNISMIRDRPMILGARIEHNEKTFFEYYRAALLTYNCYGPLEPRFDMIVAKYTTDKGTYWSYGRTIADARAFLGIRLYDEYMDLIHAVACKNTMAKREK